MSQNSAFAAHLPPPEQALARKGAADPRAVVREQTVLVSGLTEALRLLPDGGPDLKAMTLEAFASLEKLAPFDDNDTVFVRNLAAAREAVDRIRNEDTPDPWDLDKSLRLIGQAIFAAHEAPPPTQHDDEKTKASLAISRQAAQRAKPPPQAKAARLPGNILDDAGARAVYAARRKRAG